MGESGMQHDLSQRMVAGAGMQRKLSILQSSGLELEHLVREIVDANPVLEMQASDDILSIEQMEEGGSEDEAEWDDSSDFSEGADEERRAAYRYESLSSPETLASFLHEQISRSSLSPEIGQATCLLIDSLDDRGFFEEEPTVIMERNGISPETGDSALAVLRDLDPAGVGAVDIRDSLLLQLQREGEGNSLAFRLIESCWNELAKHKYEEAALRLGVSLSEVNTAMDRIRRLNPDPGADFRSESNPYIAADVIVERSETGKSGEWEARLTGAGVPHVRINDDYKEILAESSGDPALREYLKKAFAEARELISDLSSRQETILKLALILIARQRDYFDKGPKGLKPMGMESVANEMGVSTSTVSRAVSGKYLLGPWGYKELRSFFSSGIGTDKSSSEGESMASQAVQSLMLDMIRGEDASHPLSDAAIAAGLAREHGLKISRRTVAKYRDLMKVLPASLRKS